MMRPSVTYRSSMRVGLASLLVLVAAFAVAGPTSASRSASATRTCPARSIGPGALIRGNRTGAACMLHAYRHGCLPADYELSSFGVDTVATVRFRLFRRGGACAIDVTRSFRVVPQEPRVSATARCKAIRQTAAGIVATGCSGTGFAKTVSLS